ncbi:thioesterase family protein [Aeoliella sp. ICT_H6.2]|uniref:Thioesterase family protein n=1 Tax=Aeoliella straminimaris TaxID=2954799 RepID=A0A9X2JKU2_9BACT|nr:thioesterase family protein [Aeoliella straminimaris]MCO6047399.1 thioesterase family protein [Aeoliella straminimaris]
MDQLPGLREILELPLSQRATIPEDYLDEMGHMNVMWYTHLYGLAIRDLIGGCGFDRAYIEREKHGTFALEKHLRYFAEVRVGQQVSVYSRVIGCNAVRYHLLQFMVNDTTQRLASSMETVSAHVDLIERRSAAMPPAIAEAFGELVRQHQQLAWEPPVCGVMGVDI